MRVIACLLLGFWMLPTLVEAATLAGMVEMPPERPQRRMVKRYSDSDMAQMGPPAPRIAVVYLTGEDLPERELPDIAIMRQEGLQFYPRILPVQVGTTVQFPNYDNTYHNVFSYSKEKRFDLGRYQKGEGPPEVEFSEPGTVSIFCEVHEHMRANILVLDTPWFTSTNSDGNFNFEDIPTGTYTINVWLSPRVFWSQSITITEGMDPVVVRR